MKLVLTCLVLLVLTYISKVNAMIYERVIRVTDNEVIRTWSSEQPLCQQVVNDCISILKKEKKQCIEEMMRLKAVEKCYQPINKEII